MKKAWRTKLLLQIILDIELMGELRAIFQYLFVGHKKIGYSIKLLATNI